MTHDAAPYGAPIFQIACSTNIAPLTGLGLANQNGGGDVSSDVSSPPSRQNARHILLAFLLASWRLCVRFRPKPISLPMNLRGFIGSEIKGDPGNPSFILVWEEKSR